VAVVSALFIYPIKGARPVSVDSIDIDSGGLKGDRQFAVFLDGERCNVKQIPALMFLEARWDGTLLQLSHPGTEIFTLDTTATGSRETEPFRGSETPVLDMGDGVASWLSKALGKDVRLCRIAEPTPFVIPLPEFGDIHNHDQERFVDAAPVMLANQSSLDDLNERLEVPVEMARFRANIVVEGLEAYGEDNVDLFRFDRVALRQAAPCERCKVASCLVPTCPWPQGASWRSESS